MPRDLTTALKDEFLKALLRPVWFVEIETDSATVNVWSGVGDKSWDSKTWKGLGTLGSITPIPENAEIRASGAKLTLSGIPTDMVTLVLTDVRQGKPVRIYLGALDDTDAVIVDPYPAMIGRTDVCEIEEGGETSTIQISVENRLIDLQRSRERRYTHEDQQLDFPGDDGFEFVTEIAEANISWGKGPPLPREPEGGGPRGPDIPSFAGWGDGFGYP